MIFYHTLMKYTITKQIEADLILSKNKNNSITSSHEFQISKKIIRTSKKSKLKKPNTKHTTKYEQKDSLLITKKYDFKIFIINYSSLFSDLFYYIIMDKDYIL